MSDVEILNNDRMKIECHENGNDINLSLMGIYTLRDPREFFLPVLMKQLDHAIQNKMKICLDIREISFINAAGISSIAKVLRKSKETSVCLNLIYSKSKKWQEMSFHAFKLFETNNKSISIEGK